MAGKKATFMRSYKWRAIRRWMPRLLHELFPGPHRPWHFGPPDQRAAALTRYCRTKGRELGGRPPAARRCTKRLPPGTGRQCWNWHVGGTDRCWRHPRQGA